jgi:hypothetical protein
MAKINIQNIILGLVLLIVAFIVVFQIVASTAPDLITASNNISSSGLPLANLFSSNGVLLLVFMVAVFIGMLVLAFKAMGTGK